MDMMLGTYTYKRISRRWQMTNFYNLVDIAMLNGYILFKEIFPSYFTKTSKNRRIFIDAVALSILKSANESDKLISNIQIPSKRQKILLKKDATFVQEPKIKTNAKHVIIA